MASHDIGKIGTIECQLAAWVPPEERYQRRLVPVKPSSRVIPGSPDSVAPDTTIAEWRITDFSGGQGAVLWRDGSDRYNRGYAVQTNPEEDGVILGNEVNQTRSWGGSGADSVMNDGYRIARLSGGLGAGQDTAVYAWPNPFDDGDRWDAGNATTGTSSPITNITSGWDGVAFAVTGHENGQIRETSGPTVHYNTGTGDDFVFDPVVLNYLGNLYALDGNDLYSVSTSVTNTRTVEAQPESVNKYVSNNYLTSSNSDYPWKLNRLTSSDVGPVWWVYTDMGEVILWEYNQADDTSGAIGKLPSYVYPYDIHVERGFYFVSYRQTRTAEQEGKPYVYFQDRSGTTRGVIGPFHVPTVADRTYAHQPILIAGIAGDRLMVYCKQTLFGYDLTTGAITVIAAPIAEDEAAASTRRRPSQAVIFGNQVFIARTQTATAVTGIEMIDLGEYRTTSATGAPTLYTGAYDFGYPGITKTLLDVTVEFEEPLDAAHSVTVYYIADNSGTAVSVGTMDSSDGAIKRFTVSDSSTTVNAKRIEWAVAMTTTDATVTPKLNAISSRAAGAESRYEWILELDVSTIPNGDQAGWEIIDQLQTLRLDQTVVSFTDPWQQEATNSSDTFDVTVEEVFTPLFQGDGNLTAQVRLRAVGLGAFVAGGGGYEG